MAQRTPKASNIRPCGTLDEADFAEFKKDAAKWAKEACKSKGAAKATLIRIGLLTPSGRPSRRYYPEGSPGSKAKWNL